MKKILFFATALVAFAACTNDDFVGNNVPANENEANAIVFGGGLKAITRADHVGADAANLLNNHFTVAGFKGDGDVTATVVATGTVFDN